MRSRVKYSMGSCCVVFGSWNSGDQFPILCTLRYDVALYAVAADRMGYDNGAAPCCWCGDAISDWWRWYGGDQGGRSSTTVQVGNTGIGKRRRRKRDEAKWRGGAESGGSVGWGGEGGGERR